MRGRGGQSLRDISPKKSSVFIDALPSSIICKLKISCCYGILLPPGAPLWQPLFHMLACTLHLLDEEAQGVDISAKYCIWYDSCFVLQLINILLHRAVRFTLIARQSIGIGCTYIHIIFPFPIPKIYWKFICTFFRTFWMEGVEDLLL